MSFDSGASGRGAAGSSPYELDAADLYQAPIIGDGLFDDALFDNAGELSRQERALCAQTDPEAFFPEQGGSTREAKKICLSFEVHKSASSQLYNMMNDSVFVVDVPNVDAG